jgi:hypothetical protein
LFFIAVDGREQELVNDPPTLLITRQDHRRLLIECHHTTVLVLILRSIKPTSSSTLGVYWEEFTGNLFGYFCASHEKGLTAMEQMRTSVRHCYGWSLPFGVSVYGEKDFNASGEFTNSQVTRRLRMPTRDPVMHGALIGEQFRRELAEGTTETFAACYRA